MTYKAKISAWAERAAGILWELRALRANVAAAHGGIRGEAQREAVERMLRGAEAEAAKASAALAGIRDGRAVKRHSEEPMYRVEFYGSDRTQAETLDLDHPPAPREVLGMVLRFAERSGVDVPEPRVGETDNERIDAVAEAIGRRFGESHVEARRVWP